MKKENHHIHSVPYPLQDELALGFLGRFARLNGLSSFNAASKLLTACCPNKNRIPQLWQIAELCKINYTTFTIRHSMLPVMPTLIRNNIDHQGMIRHFTKISQKGLSVPTKNLRWCKICTHLDIEKRGFSYWRRQHQIEGIDWCIEHQHPLAYTSIKSAIYCPGHATTYSSEELSQTTIAEENKYPAIKRLQSIALCILHHPIPINYFTSGEIYKYHYFSTYCNNKNHLPTKNMIMEAFPETWLLRHIKHYSDTYQQVKINSINRVSIDMFLGKKSFLELLIILTIAFDSTKIAMSALAVAEFEIAAWISSKVAADSVFNNFLINQSWYENCKEFSAYINNTETRI